MNNTLDSFPLQHEKLSKRDRSYGVNIWYVSKSAENKETLNRNLREQSLVVEKCSAANYY